MQREDPKRRKTDLLCNLPHVPFSCALFFRGHCQNGCADGGWGRWQRQQTLCYSPQLCIPRTFSLFLPMTDSIRSLEEFLSMSIMAYYLQKGVSAKKRGGKQPFKHVEWPTLPSGETESFPITLYENGNSPTVLDLFVCQFVCFLICQEGHSSEMVSLVISHLWLWHIFLYLEPVKLV